MKMTLDHKFKGLCLDWEYVLAKPTVNDYLRRLHRQGQSEDAQKLVQPYKDYSLDVLEYSPMYFGMGVEILAEAYLKFYGGVHHAVTDIEMASQDGKPEVDLGVDGRARTICEYPLKKTRRIARSNSPVYLQVKGTLNSAKVYKANDGSRLTNFVSNATTHATKSGQAYQARYLLFTTGAGIHHVLDAMTNGFIEVIDYKKIKQLTRKDHVFWSAFREAVGLAPLALDAVTLDPDYIAVSQRLDELGIQDDSEEPLIAEIPVDQVGSRIRLTGSGDVLISAHIGDTNDTADDPAGAVVLRQPE